MEPGEWMVWGITWAVLYVGLSYIVNKSRKSRRLPPGPKGWPLLGSLPSLGAMPHASLYNLSRKYGPIMYLNLGTSGMVVASAPETAKAFLKTLGANFSNRPRNASATYLTYEANDMVFAPYGRRWNMLRKVCNLHLLGGKALGGWQPVREAETSHMLRSILHHSNRSQPVNLPELLSYTMANLLGQITLSKRVFESQGAEANEFKDMVVQVLISTGLFNIGDVIPSIAWMDLQGIQRNMKKLHRRFDALLTRMIAEHQSSSHQRGRQDFLDVMISHRDNADGEGGKLTDVHIKSLLMDLFTAGTDTSSSTMEWAMAEMLNNPEIAKRAQEEMDAVVGKQRKLRESDIPKLPYLAAICKETFRKHPSTPASNRVSTEACEVGGYYIPKNTRLMVNLWAIGRNPEVWENPLEFNPDRFLGANSKIEPRGNDFELIPFGAGRRICPGNGMAIQVVPYILGSLIHSFDWHLPPDVPHVNMDETYGLALQKAVPLVALATPRLPLHLY